MDTLNDYHKERNRKACLLVEDMKQKPSTLEEMRQQTQRILSNKSTDMKIEKCKTETLSFMKGKDIDRDKYQELFAEIIKSRSADNLEEIAKKYDLKIDEEKYPRLDFQITKNEINELIAQKKISIDESKSDYLSFNQKDLDPLAKLLYSIIWKQGDLQKLKHIIRGIRDSEKESTEFDSDAIVFHSFGNHLANHLENPSKSPIIDQHVIRAYNVFDNFSQEEKIRKIDKVKKEDREKYLEWINSNFKDRDSDFMYSLDKLLFAIGKSIKPNREKLPTLKAFEASEIF